MPRHQGRGSFAPKGRRPAAARSASRWARSSPPPGTPAAPTSRSSPTSRRRSAGIGFLINDARDFLRTDVIVVGLLVYGLLGLGADALMRAVERRALSWRPALIKG